MKKVFASVMVACLAGVLMPASASAAPDENAATNVLAEPAEELIGEFYAYRDGVAAASKAADGSKAAAAVTAIDRPYIWCKVTANYPHNSHHVPGRVNATTTVTCDYQVRGISGHMDLTRDGALVSSGARNEIFKNRMQMNAWTMCHPGTYQTKNNVTVSFPMGYSPPIASGTFFSRAKAVTC